MNLITEQELQATALEAAGWRVFHVSDSRKEVRDGETYRLVGDPQAAGYPDLSASRSGEALWAELKSQRGQAGTGAGGMAGRPAAAPGLRLAAQGPGPGHSRCRFRAPGRGGNLLGLPPG